MDFDIITSYNKNIARLVNDRVVVNNVQDAIDLLGNADYQGARDIIIEEKQINPLFFDLKTGIAGEILQKFSNYRMKLAIIGDFERYESKSLRAFIIECNRGNTVFFVPNEKSGIERLINS